MRTHTHNVVYVLAKCSPGPSQHSTADLSKGIPLCPASQQPPADSHKADGILVLSEFVGSARVLNGAMRINPFNLEDVVDQAREEIALPPQ